MGRFPSESDTKIIQGLVELEQVIEKSYTCVIEKKINNANAVALKSLKPRVQKARRASNRPIALGVFGPSQVGKSFLISELARQNDTRLWIKDPQVTKGVVPEQDKNWIQEENESGGNIDFIKYINVDVGGETTAVICRFTTNPMLEPVEDDTFVAAILSHKDLLLSLVQGFSWECEAQPIESPAQIINRTFIGDEKVTGEKDGLLQDVIEAWEYVQEHKRHIVYYDRLLEAGILGRLSEIGKVERHNWVKFASLLWGGDLFPVLGDMYARLLGALEKIKFSEHIEIPTKTIASGIDGPVYIGQLEKLLTENTPIEVTVRHRPSERFSTKLTVPELCAIISELYLPVYRMSSPSDSDILEQGDILDFPGAVPPLGEYGFKPDKLVGDEGKKNAGKVLKRGKLTYLFERYCAEREVTALLLCLSVNTFQAHILPSQVGKWIETRYPNYPNLNYTDSQNPSLFLAVTRFDEFFKLIQTESKKEANIWTAFFNRVKGFLEDTSEPKWFSCWPKPQEAISDTQQNKSKTFTNTYWVWNPAYWAKPENFEFILKRLQGEYDDSAEVREHVSEAEKRWQAALPKDSKNTGIDILKSAISTIFRGDLKRAEIINETKIIWGETRKLIAEFYVPTDQTECMAKNRKAAQMLIEEIDNQMRFFTFGPLLRTLSLSPHTVNKVFRQMSEGQPSVIDFVENLIKSWQKEVVKCLEEPEISVKLHISTGNLSKLVEELSIRAQSPEFKNRLVDSLEFFLSAIRGPLYFQTTSRQICLKLWNDFIMNLGKPISSLPTPIIPPIPSKELRPFKRYFEHWRKYLPDMYEENCRHGARIPDYNEQIKKYLDQLDVIKEIIITK